MVLSPIHRGMEHVGRVQHHHDPKHAEKKMPSKAERKAEEAKEEARKKLEALKPKVLGEKRYDPNGEERFHHIHLQDDDDEHSAIALGRHIPAPKPPPKPKVEPPRHQHHKEARAHRKANKKMYRHHRHFFHASFKHMYRSLPDPVQDHPFVGAGAVLGALVLLFYWVRRLIVESEERAQMSASKKGARADFHRFDPRACVNGGPGAAWAAHALPPAVKKAAMRGEVPAVVEWLKSSADPDASDADGKTVAHHAASHGHEALVRTLLERGASPDAVDAAGETPLHAASRAGSAACVRVLLEAGADVRAETKVRETPASIASHAGNAGCARLIQRREREMSGGASTSDGLVSRRGGGYDDAV